MLINSFLKSTADLTLVVLTQNRNGACFLRFSCFSVAKKILFAWSNCKSWSFKSLFGGWILTISLVFVFTCSYLYYLIPIFTTLAFSKFSMSYERLQGQENLKNSEKVELSSMERGSVPVLSSFFNVDILLLTSFSLIFNIFNRIILVVFVYLQWTSMTV